MSVDFLAGRIATHLQRLCVQIGARPGGSPANQAAAEYIRDVYLSCGLEGEMEEFPCPAWQDRGTSLTVNGAPLEAVANSFSPPCDVTAPVVAAGTIAELQAADLNGRVAILYGDLTADILSAKSWFLKSEHDDQIIRLLEDKAPSAVITVQARLGELQRLIEDWEFNIPSATVPAGAGLALLAAEHPVVHLRVDSRRAPGRTWNVIGRKAGISANRVVLCAHYDTKFDTPGALDNGGGVGVLLALAERLSRTDHNLSLDCIAFGNEDTGLPIGSGVYVDRHQDQLDQIVALLNFDGVGHALDANTVTLMAHSQALKDLVDGQLRRHAGMIWVDPWPQSDHSSFAARGVACLAFTSRATSYLAHLRCDTVEWASPAKLAEVAGFALDTTAGLQDRTPEWARAPMPQS
jgi:aminopeptidase YwaD